MAIAPKYKNKNTVIYLKFFVTFLNACFILQYSNIVFSYFSILIILINSFSYAKSYGFLPALSVAFLFAPFISNFFTILELPEITAKCNGVKPCVSL